jgi:hypothetical protein
MKGDKTTPSMKAAMDKALAAVKEEMNLSTWFRNIN